MTSVRLGRLGLLAAFGAGAACAVAGANSFTLTFDGFGLNKTVGIHYEAADAYNAPTASTFSNIKAGHLLFNGTVRAYCLQVFEGLPPVGDSARWEEAPISTLPEAPPAPGPMGALKAILVTDLYARHYNDSLGTADKAAAFQVALWEITHENLDESGNDASLLLAQLSLSLGGFQLDTSSSVFGDATTYLSDLGNGGFRQFGTLLGLTNPDFQDLIVVVPLPAPALLAGLGLIGAAFLRRRAK